MNSELMGSPKVTESHLKFVGKYRSRGFGVAKPRAGIYSQNAAVEKSEVRFPADHAVNMNIASSKAVNEVTAQLLSDNLL